MARLFIRFVGAAMETFRPFTNHAGASIMSGSCVPDLTDYQWYKGYADIIDKLVTKCWQERSIC